MFSAGPTDAPIGWLDSDHVMCLLQVHVRSSAIEVKQLQVTNIAAEAREQTSKQGHSH
jgi:hypothetical protein